MVPAEVVVSRTCTQTAELVPQRSPLRVGAVHDPLEREADAVADRVLRMPSPGPSLLQRCPGGCPDEEVLRRQAVEPEDDEEALLRTPSVAATTAPPARDGAAVAPEVGAAIAARRGSGSPLPAASRRFFEPRFGVDLGAVRVHHDAGAAVVAARVDARAFTVGRDVFFGSGEWAPGSSVGDRLLAHELTHTLQQAGRNTLRSNAMTIRRAPAGTTPLHVVQPGESLSELAGYPNAGWEAKLEQLIAANPDHPNIKGKPRTDPQFGWLEVGDTIHIPWGSCPPIACPFEGTRSTPHATPPDYPQRRTPGLASGGLCRGACGPDCPDSCVAVAPMTYCHYDPASGCHAECRYDDVVSCFTHEGCRVHDDCYDVCAQGGELDLCGCPVRACAFGAVCANPCHCRCDTECCNTHGRRTCYDWYQGDRSAPTDGEFVYTDNVTSAVTPGACPNP